MEGEGLVSQGQSSSRRGSASLDCTLLSCLVPQARPPREEAIHDTPPPFYTSSSLATRAGPSTAPRCPPQPGCWSFSSEQGLTATSPPAPRSEPVPRELEWSRVRPHTPSGK